MVVTYVKAGWKLIGIMGVVLPILRDVQRARQEPVRTDPAETVDALRFWVARRQSLPVYRLAARREADQMIRTWQARAVRDLPASSLTALTDGTVVTLGGQLARYHTTRWLFRRVRVAAVWMVVLGLLVYLIVR